MDDYNKTIAEELNENDRILEELGNKEARQRNSEYRTQIMSKLSELNEIFEELELISKNTEDFSNLMQGKWKKYWKSWITPLCLSNLKTHWEVNCPIEMWQEA